MEDFRRLGKGSETRPAVPPLQKWAASLFSGLVDETLGCVRTIGFYLFEAAVDGSQHKPPFGAGPNPGYPDGCE